MIAAVAENGVIGREGSLPWKLRDDMRFFVRTTRGHTVVMGRLNYESIGRPLPSRRNIVVSRKVDLSIPGCEVVTSLPGALRIASSQEETEAFVIGGAQIYALAEPYAHCYYRTRVLADVPGDIVFPHIDFTGWKVEQLETQVANDDNEYPFVVERLTRSSAPMSYE